MVIDIFADVVCPWCYIGKRRLELALKQRPGLAVERRWRPFQLRPDMPEGGEPWAEFVDQKFGGPERARQIFAQVTGIGAADGLHFDFGRITRSPNTRDAHRLLVYASNSGREWQLADALFAAYFAEGRDLNDRDELAAIAASVGLDEAASHEMLASDAFNSEIDSSQRDAERLGISGVPFFILDERFAISGAQPVELFLRGLELASEPAAR